VACKSKFSEQVLIFGERVDLKLNVGSGGVVAEGWVSVDICPPADIIANLNHAWPWVTSTVSQIVMNDVIEHLQCKIHAMNEISRVLRPGGTLEISVPSTDGRGAFQDPTHITFWNENSWRYFDIESQENQRFSESYGIRTKLKLIAADTKERPDNIKHARAIFQSVK
jgi:SAM-dependent methyltransferase